MSGQDRSPSEPARVEYPWASCLLTDLLISHLEKTSAASKIDYGALFRNIDGLEVPTDPQAFLTDAGNWVPLPILRELLSHCERLTGRKDIAYHASRAVLRAGKAG